MFVFMFAQEIGGQDPTEALRSPQEIRMREHVMNVLEEHGMEMRPVVSVFLFFFFLYVSLRG